jgi:hypothetical protein
MTSSTPRFRIEARAEWRADGKPATRNTLISAVNPGDSKSGWQSEKVRSVNELKAIFKAANTKKKITFLLQTVYSAMVFPKEREIYFLSIEFKEWQGKQAILIPHCNDLKVVSSAPSTAEKQHSAVTLEIKSDNGFTDV